MFVYFCYLGFVVPFFIVIPRDTPFLRLMPLPREPRSPFGSFFEISFSLGSSCTRILVFLFFLISSALPKVGHARYRFAALFASFSSATPRRGQTSFFCYLFFGSERISLPFLVFRFVFLLVLFETLGIARGKTFQNGNLAHAKGRHRCSMEIGFLLLELRVEYGFVIAPGEAPGGSRRDSFSGDICA